jgi:uncharacterized protein (DUF488 family)
MGNCFFLGSEFINWMYTIGYSTRTIDEFLRLLKEYGVEILVDVRRWPTSRRCPYFERSSLEASLREEGIGYAWLGGSLGGYRKDGLGEVSPNMGWESGGFRNYADYALSEEFRRGLEEVLRLAEGGRAALMCAEKHYWRCHRRIISDHLVARGVPVAHIVEGGRTVGDRLTGFAVVRDGVPVYPPRSALPEEVRSGGSPV